MKQRISVIKEGPSGRNEGFRDNRTGKVYTRGQLSDRIEAGEYPRYHVRVINNKRTPVSNPDGRESNNLG